MTTVATCRYTYYLISGAKIVKIPVAVKKSITVMQMVQFGFLMGQVCCRSPHGFS